MKNINEPTLINSIDQLKKLCASSSSGRISGVLAPSALEEVLKNVHYINGRGIERFGDVNTFAFDDMGRFDSFTSSCDGLEEFKTEYGYDLTETSDHAFVYTHKFDKTTPSTSGYVLFIRDGRLFEKRTDFRGGYPMHSSVREIVPNRLLAYLDTQPPLPFEDTVMERMWWVGCAKNLGLIDQAYPRFLPAIDQRGRFKAFPANVKLTARCIPMPYRGETPVGKGAALCHE